MSINKLLLLISAGVLAVLGLGGGLIVWPAYREAHAINTRIVTLLHKAQDLTAQTREIEALSNQLEDLRRHAGDELKLVPESADVAGLIRKLSLPVDGATVLDQEFSAGQATMASQDERVNMKAAPLTVEMTATFETVVALLRAVESMDRLVRVTVVHLNCKRSPDAMDDISQLTASLGLEAIYEPASTGEATEEVK